MHLRSIVFAFAVVALSTAAFAQPGAIPAPLNPGVLLDSFQINYLPAPVGGGNINGYVDITNAGQLGAPAPHPHCDVRTYKCDHDQDADYVGHIVKTTEL